MRENLRRTIRPPQRFDPDQFHLPLSRRSIRKTGNDMKSQSTEYNPNLPPAAFPTLDISRNVKINGSKAQQNGTDEDIPSEVQQGIIRRSLDDLSQLTDSERQTEASLIVDFEDIPMDELDDHIASNGNLNPIWLSNMSKMAAAIPDAHGDMDMDMDMDDSDSNEVVDGEPKPSTEPRCPSWPDLSDRMQAEIFKNLLEHYRYPTVCRMLGLGARERQDVQEALEYRQEQVKLEDIQLKEMQTKQLKELLKTDNSLRRQKQSHQLVFRKASRQTFRRLREVMDPDVDFFSCEASELTAAKTFLRVRGIEARFAGNWGNETTLIHTSTAKAAFQTVGSDRTLPGHHPVTGIGLTSNEARPPTITTTTAQLETSRDPLKEVFSNWLGNTPTGSTLLQPIQRSGNTTARPPRWLTLLLEKIDPEEHHRARTKRQKIDVVERHNRHSAPPELLSSREPLDDYFSEEPALRQWLERQQQQHTNTPERTSPDPGHSIISSPSMEHREVFGPGHHLQRSNSDSSSQRAGHPGPLRRRLLSTSTRKPEIARKHIQKQSQRQEQVSTIRMENNTDSPDADTDITGLVKTRAFIPLSPSPAPTPRKTELLSSPETELFQFSNLPSPRTVATSTPSPADTSGDTYAEDENDDVENEYEYDEIAYEDEIVLLPMDVKCEVSLK
ncbi:hypothetical protein BDW62DRAFT_203598 [Aspergillus aurantiobrunneus]